MLYSRSVRAGALALILSLSPAVAHAESLRAALTSAYLNDPDILSALLAVKSTAEGIALAKGEKLPTIAAGGSVNSGFTTGTSAAIVPPTVSWDATYSQTLFDNLKSDADIEAARALTEASRYGLQSAEENVLLQVVTAYFSVIEDTQLVQLAEENDKFFQAQVNSANDRLEDRRGHQDRPVAGAGAPRPGDGVIPDRDRQFADRPGALPALRRTQAGQFDLSLQVGLAVAGHGRCRRAGSVEDLRRVVGPELGPAGAEDGDLVAVPGGGVVRRKIQSMMAVCGLVAAGSSAVYLAIEKFFQAKPGLVGEVRRASPRAGPPSPAAGSSSPACGRVVLRVGGGRPGSSSETWPAPGGPPGRVLPEQPPGEREQREQQKRAAFHARGLLAGLAVRSSTPIDGANS